MSGRYKISTRGIMAQRGRGGPCGELTRPSGAEGNWIGRPVQRASAILNPNSP
jgi:hypothetical protein